VEAASRDGRRTVDAADLYLGPLETSLRPGELITSAWFPSLAEGTRSGFVEVSRRHGDYAVCGVAVAIDCDPDGVIVGARAAYISVSDTPVVLDLSEATVGRFADVADFADAGRLAAAGVHPDGDIHASAEYRRHLADVLTVRALRQAAA
ncbi:MAG: hypothetical protein WCB04_12075, partial [Mycobacteriales bacterium]